MQDFSKNNQLIGPQQAGRSFTRTGPPSPYGDFYDLPPYGYSGAALFSSDEPSGLGEYWRILRRRKGILFVIAVLGAILAIVLSILQKPVYQAYVSLEIQDINPDFPNLTQVSPETQTYNALSDIQTQMTILQSESLKDRTLAKFGIEKTTKKSPVGNVSLIERLRRLPQRFLPQPVPKGLAEVLKRRRDLIIRAADSLRVRTPGPTRVIEAYIDSTDPQVAADYANALANEYIDQNTEAHWKMSQRTADWLSRQIDDMRVKLESSEHALQTYAQQAGLLFTGGVTDNSKTNVSDEKLRQLQESLSTASSDRVLKESRYRVATTSPPEALPDVLNDPTLQGYQTKLTDLKRQLAELAAIYTPDFPKIKRLNEEIQTLESELVRERTAVIDKIKNEYQEAVLREKMLTDQYQAQAQTVNHEAEKTIQYNILKREADTNRQLYETMLQRVKESSIAAALRASNVRVVDSAEVPIRPYKPNLSTNAALGLLLGLFGGVGFVIMRERSDKTLRMPGEAPRWLNVPELGVVPSFTKARLGVLRRAALDPRSPMALEAYRVILTSVILSQQNGDSPRMLVVTSPSPGEGKTTVANNLAITLAEVGKKVLLIDADLSRPRLHTIFEISNECGLSSLLESTSVEESLLRQAIHQISPALWVLPSGPASQHSSNLLFAKVMPELLAKLKGEFDMIVVDTSPLTMVAHARILGRLADGVIIVTRAGQTTREAALTAIQRLVEDYSPVLGTVLNDWDPKSSPNPKYVLYDTKAVQVTRDPFRPTPRSPGRGSVRSSNSSSAGL